MNSPLVFLLFLSALIIGFLLAKGPAVLTQWLKSKSTPRQEDYYKESLNYLINEQPDAAIDALTATLEVNEETLETHMALGDMLRKRGEVDRAIRIHKNVLSRVELSEHQMLQARLALADDYLKAGLFDRAESLYCELSSAREQAIAIQALKRLVDVYQREGEWQQAVVSADSLAQIVSELDAKYWRQLQAQFYCEIAEQAMTSDHQGGVESALRKAQGLDPDLPRVLILQGRLALAQGRDDDAFNVLKAIPLSSTAHNSQVLPLLIDAYTKTQSPEQLHGLLAGIYTAQRSALLLPSMTRAMAEQEGEAAAILFLVQEIQQWLHLSTLSDILTILPQSAYRQLSLDALLGVVENRLDSTQAYECQRCGYSGHKHHWHCPSCKEWGGIVALY